MPTSDLPAVNFTISAAGKDAIEQVRREHDDQFPNDPAAVMSVGWGIFMADTPRQIENVVIGVYPQSMLGEVVHGIQQVSGLNIIFFTVPEYLPKFEGKVLDHSAERGFFLREP